MATFLSPSPSPSSGGSSSSSGGRRLSEILEEQQEPFSLDLFLLDKGCSPALLDAAGAACWPRSRAAAAVASALRPRRSAPGGLLRVIVSRILRAKKVGGKRPRAAAIDWSGPKNAARPPSPSSRRVGGAVEADMEEEEEEEEDDDESSKQLSPVSVLEQSPFEPASPAYSKKAIVIFRELLAAAYTPALPDHPTSHSSSTSTSSTPPNSPAPAPSTRTSPTASSAAASHWEETLEAELARVHGLIATEMAAGGWSVLSFSDARRHVGAEVAAAVLEALTEEAAAELLAATMLTWNGRPRCDGDVDAIGDAARCVVGAS
ncbi:nucleolin-like isoform X1 [Oryza brachyantha]|nr:nucleolin-like isoform X1 [Oryza brachyantha]